MFRRRFKHLKLPEDRGPLKVMFIHTEVVVGGAETLLVEIIRNLDRERFIPELCCLKRLSTLGEVLAKEVPTFAGLLRNKYDVVVLGKLMRLLRRRRIDSVITVGTGGDRMFWGRLAAWRAGVPVILSSLHSTGYPVKLELLNRLLAPLSDGFIGCARTHSEYLASGEKCPRNKVFTIYNGVDVERFRPLHRPSIRRRLGLPAQAPIAGIVAALRPEKQHCLLLDAMRIVVRQFPDALLLIIGDGPQRGKIEAKVRHVNLEQHVRLLGMRHDVPQLLSALDVKVLSSKMEANPASTLEASSCEVPVVAPAVGSLPETVLDGLTGILYRANDPQAMADAVMRLFANPQQARSMGQAGRKLVCRRFSVQSMVSGYQTLIDGIYRGACLGQRFAPAQFDQLCSMGAEWSSDARCQKGQVAL